MSQVRHNRRVWGALIALAWAIVSAPTVGADTILYNNVDHSIYGGGGNYGITNGTSDQASGPLADSFSTGSTTIYLTDVKVSLTYFGTIGNGSTHVELFSDSSTAPGTLLTTVGTLADTNLTGSLTIFDFTLSTPFALAANTRYWIGLVADPTNGSVAAWSSSDSAAGTGVAGQYLEYQGGIYANDNGPWNMEVIGSAVPEPSSIVSALSGVLCLAGFTWCRKRKTAAVSA
jgi:hypothetical protein